MVFSVFDKEGLSHKGSVFLSIYFHRIINEKAGLNPPTPITKGTNNNNQNKTKAENKKNCSCIINKFYIIGCCQSHE